MSCTRIAEASGIAGVATGPAGELVALAAFDRSLIHRATSQSPQTVRPIGEGRFDAELALGRKLFHRASDSRTTGVGIACATCHPDGREDGLVWRLDGERRQTPLLAGRLAETAPYNWRGSSPTLEENIKQTVTRLRGSGLPEADSHALARYLVEGLRPPSRPQSSDPGLVESGRRVFADPAVGCATCHDPERAFTDGLTYDIGSTGPTELSEMRKVDAKAMPIEFDVPSLRYVGLTAPYFHDGRIATLEQLIDDNGATGDRMGTTAGLSALEKKALVAYLRSL
jgi:cytochrome c peroxidase